MILKDRYSNKLGDKMFKLYISIKISKVINVSPKEVFRAKTAVIVFFISFFPIFPPKTQATKKTESHVLAHLKSPWSPSKRVAE